MNDEYSNFGEYLNLRDRKIDPALKVISRWDLNLSLDRETLCCERTPRNAPPSDS